MCLQSKKVHGFLRGAVRSVSKWLAVHCIATPVLPLQRVFPHTMHSKQDRKLHLGLRQGQATHLLARRPAQRPATDWGRHTPTPDALKTGHFKQTFTKSNILPTQNDTKKIAVAPPPWPGDAPFGISPGPVRSYSVGAGHFHPRCIENCAFQKTLTDFNILPTRYGTKILHWRLRQGQAMRHSARRLAQRPARHRGRHTATPDALKTRRCKQTFTHFNILPTQYNREKRIGASAKARRRAFRRTAWPNVRQGIGGGTLPPSMH